MASNVQPQAVATVSHDPAAERYRRNRIILSALAIVIGVPSIVTNLGGAFSGEIPSICRALLGLVGLAAGVLIWLRPPLGWRLGWVWALIQIPVFAWSPEGSPTTQWLNIPLGVTSQTTVNGEITSYSSIGVNLVGIILFIVFQRLRASADQPNA